MLCFCLESIPRDGKGGSCWGSLLCQHLNRICSGCSHLIHTAPHFQSLFQSFYLSLKAFNCFLNVSRLESAQVSGWRYPLGRGIVGLSPRERPCLLGHPAGLPRAMQAPLQPPWGYVANFSPSLGAGRKTEVMGGFVALLADFPPAKSICPSVSLGEAGERCGKSLQKHGYLPQLLLQGF